MFRRTRLAVPLIPLVLWAGACSDTSSADPADERPVDGPDVPAADFRDARELAQVEVDVRDNTFDEQYLEVTAGTTVTFRNVGRTEHNVYPVADGTFSPIDATDLEPDETGAITFDEPGDVAYYCTLHGTTTKGMVGAIRVVA